MKQVGLVFSAIITEHGEKILQDIVMFIVYRVKEPLIHSFLGTCSCQKWGEIPKSQ